MVYMIKLLKVNKTLYKYFKLLLIIKIMYFVNLDIF